MKQKAGKFLAFLLAVTVAFTAVGAQTAIPVFAQEEEQTAPPAPEREEQPKPEDDTPDETPDEQPGEEDKDPAPDEPLGDAQPLGGTIVPYTVFSGNCGASAAWSLDDTSGVLTISGTGAMEDYIFLVTWPGWDAMRSDITTVVIEDGITHIGNLAFMNCTNLADVTIGEDVQKIGDNAFSNTALSDITIGESVRTIGNVAFANCTNLVDVTMGAGVQKIGDNAFSNTSLANVTIGNGVQTIGDYAFSFCPALTDVTMGAGVQTIGDNAFYGCASLTEVTIGTGVQTIGDYAFSGCASLTDLTMGAGIQMIGGHAFDFCISLTEITFLGDTPPAIGIYAFANVAASGIVYYPVTSANYSGILSTMKGLPDLPAGWSARGGTATSGRCGADAYWNLDTSGVLTISGTGAMDDYDHSSSFPEWYAQRTNVTTVVIEDGIQTIGNNAFYDCSALAEITFLGDTPPVMGSDAFGSVAASGIVYYPVTSANYSGILSTMSLQPPGWSARGGTATSGRCGADAYWNLDTSGVLTISGTGAMDDYNHSSSFPEWYAQRTNVTTVVIEDGIQTIGLGAFYNCTNLAGVTIRNSVQTIVGGAFSGCTNLVDVTMGAGVQTIGGSAFYDCTALAEITFLSNTPPTMEADAFWGVPSAGIIYYPHTSTGFNVAWKNGISDLSGWTLVPVGTTPPQTGDDNDRDSTYTYVPAKAESPAALTVTAQRAKAALDAMKPEDIKAGIAHNGSIKVSAEAWAVLGNTPVNFDSTADNAVQVRIGISRPGMFTTDLMAGGSVKGPIPDSRKAMFEKWFENKIQIIHLEQPVSFGRSVEIAAKTDLAGVDIKNIVFYSYNAETHSCIKIQNPNAWKDANGYLHFTSTLAGDIVVSDGELVKK